jgi:hypothetical protein
LAAAYIVAVYATWSSRCQLYHSIAMIGERICSIDTIFLNSEMRFGA